MFSARSKPSCHRVATLAWPDLHRRRDEKEQLFALRKKYSRRCSNHSDPRKSSKTGAQEKFDITSCRVTCPSRNSCWRTKSLRRWASQLMALRNHRRVHQEFDRSISWAASRKRRRWKSTPDSSRRRGIAMAAATIFFCCWLMCSASACCGGQSPLACTKTGCKHRQIKRHRRPEPSLRHPGARQFAKKARHSLPSVRCQACQHSQLATQVLSLHLHAPRAHQ